MNPPPFFRPSDKHQPVPDLTQLELPPGGQYYTNGHTMESYVRWPAPVPGPETVIIRATGKHQVIPAQEKSGPPASNDYAEPVSPEEEWEYAHGTAFSQAETAQAKETPEQWNERKKGENNAAIFAQMEAKDQQANEWLTVLPAAVLAGDELSKIQLPPRQAIISDWFSEGDCGFIFAPRGLGKTWMNLGLAVAITTGGAFGPYKSQVAWPVLYVDGEMPF